MSWVVTPEVMLTVWLAILMIAVSAAPNYSTQRFADFAMGGVAIILFSTFLQSPSVPDLWVGLYVADPLAIFFKRFFLGTCLIILWMMRSWASTLPVARNEFLIIPMVSTLGMLLLASATDFILIFVAIELVTISFYILVAYRRTSPDSLEAGVKYLIIGALSTGIFVYGIAFLIGTVGATNLREIAYVLSHYPNVPAPIAFAMIMILVGIGFKIAAAPFHVWAPDVYQGAPLPITAFLAVGSKAAGFVVLLRAFMFDGFNVAQFQLLTGSILSVLALFSILLGSFAAITQRNIKRLMGYSSIANAGFLLMGLSAMNDRGAASVIIYLILYSIAALLAFFLICHLSPQLGGDEFRNYFGLSQRSPFLALALTLAFVSLAGIPPLAGFFGKFLVFGAAWQSGQYALLAMGVVGAVAGLYYYLGIVRAMYWQEPLPDAPAIRTDASTYLFAGLFSLAILVFGFWQQPILELANAVIVSFP